MARLEQLLSYGDYKSCWAPFLPLRYACYNISGISSLKEKQVEAIMDRVFLFVCRELRSYTGYGKSLCYALLLDSILGREQGMSVDYFLCLYSYCLDDGATR